MTPAHPTIAMLTAPKAGIWAEQVINLLIWNFFVFNSISFIEPSPSDVFLLPLMLVWFFTECKFHKPLIIIFALTLLRLFLEIFTLFPYLRDQDATSYVFYTFVVSVMCMFFAALFSNNTSKRIDIFLRAYFWSCVLASLVAIVTYFDVGGTAERFAPGGRSWGTFKDPNVMGSYCILGAIYALQAVLLKNTRHIFGMATGFLVICVGILLTFSRGSIGVLIIACAMVVFFSFVTAYSKKEGQRVAIVFAGISTVIAIGLAILLSNEGFRELISQRATLLQDYDAGETGRFGNQIRSIPLILDRLWTGMGPLQFRLIYDLEPHNAYLGAFANSGIVGGFVFIALVLTTGFVGFRLCSVYSPYQRYAQVMWPALFCHFLQAFQIDIDHWRFFLMLIGAVWALEVGRMRWLQQTQMQKAPPQAATAAPLRSSISA